MLEKVREAGRDSAKTQSGARTGRDLFKATTPFAVESVKTSWWLVGSTFVMLSASLVGAALAPVWPLRLLFSVLSALLMVRAFITYHDYMHNAILSNSRFAWLLFRLYAAFALTPPRSWKKSHNYHHGHVGKIAAASVGAFPIMTTDMWRDASLATRFGYRVERHPLTILAGYLTIFVIGVTLIPLFRNPARHWDSLLVLLGHSTLIAILWIFGGFILKCRRHIGSGGCGSRRLGPLGLGHPGPAPGIGFQHGKHHPAEKTQRQGQQGHQPECFPANILGTIVFCFFRHRFLQG